MKLLHLLPLVTCLHLPLLAADTPAAEAPVNPADVWDLTLLYPNQAAFDAAVEEVFQAGHRLLHALETTAPPKDREAEAAKARARNAERFGHKAPA